MRILPGECVNAEVKAAFLGHAVKTVAEIGWRGSADGPLLTHAQESFDVFVTIDRRLEHQQNLKKLRLGFVIIRVPNNEIGSYKAIFAELSQAAETVKAGQVIRVLNPSIRE